MLSNSTSNFNDKIVDNDKENKNFNGTLTEELMKQIEDNFPKNIFGNRDKELSEYFLKKSSNGISTDNKKKLEKMIVGFESIIISNDDFSSLDDFTKQIFKNIGKVTFNNCTLYLNKLEESGNFIFIDCFFKKDYIINPIDEKSNYIDYRFVNCKFYNNVIIEPLGNNNVIHHSLFYSCSFDKNFFVRNLEFKGDLIKLPDLKDLCKNENIIESKDDIEIKIEKIKNKYTFNIIRINDCIFAESVRLNGWEEDYTSKEESDKLDLVEININELSIADTIFDKKLEIKNSNIVNLKFKNSNVLGMFDSFESKIIKAEFSKSIFKDFAAFEYVVFGDGKIENITDFIYTTFKDFSNFRNAKFHSGLNFSSANIKQEPNFLNAALNTNFTDRETLRIIKNSFEKVNNKIESNRFFTYEMREYRKETKWLKNPFRRFVLDANYTISGFGNNYVWPILILFASVALYVYLLIHQNEWVVKTLNLVNVVGGDTAVSWFNTVTYYANEGSKVIIPFNKLLEAKQGFEFISLIFFIWFGVLIWQTIVAVKRNTQH